MPEGFLLPTFPSPEGVRLLVLKGDHSVHYVDLCHFYAENHSVAPHMTWGQLQSPFKGC